MSAPRISVGQRDGRTRAPAASGLCRKSILMVLCALCAAATVSAGEASTKPVPPVREEELQRAARTPGGVFSWKTTAAPKVVKPVSDAEPSAQDLISGEVVIKALGPFSRVEQDGKEVLTLTEEVEIEQIQTKSVLRGQKIKVVRDLKNGQTELLEAQENVEVVTPERKGRGDALSYKTKFGPNGAVLEDLYILEGNHAKGTRATLWQGDDAIQAERFISDRRMDTFRVIGAPAAIITLPQRTQVAPQPAEAKAGPGGGMLPGLSFSGGTKVRMKADGEMTYEGAGGKVRITRNVILQQDGPGGTAGIQISSDEAFITLTPAPAGSEGSASVFSGTLKVLDTVGRVEIKTATQTILCDRGVLDMQKNTFTMEAKGEKPEVHVYLREKAMLLLAPRSLTVNMDTGAFYSPGPLRVEAFAGVAPSNRTTPTPAPAEVKPKK